jgi:hypothetical protein
MVINSNADSSSFSYQAINNGLKKKVHRKIDVLTHCRSIYNDVTQLLSKSLSIVILLIEIASIRLV